MWSGTALTTPHCWRPTPARSALLCANVSNMRPWNGNAYHTQQAIRELALQLADTNVRDGTPARVSMTSRRRHWPVVSGFVGIVAIQVVVALISIDVLSSVRAFVSGES